MKKEEKVITIVGATGHLGNTLIRELVKEGERIRAVVPPFEDNTPLKNLDIEIVEGDVRNINSLLKAFEGAEIVYHMAGIVAISPGKRDLMTQVNVIGTQNVVNACLKTGVKRLVYTSSIHAIAEPPKDTVIDESFPFDPKKVQGDYAKSKALATLEVLKGVEEGLDAVILCPTGIIGPYDYKISEMGQLILDFMNKNLKTYVDGAYDFVDVRDVAKGHILAAKKGRKKESYILSGERITVYALLKILEELTNIKAPSFKIPYTLATAIAPLTPIYYSITRKKPLFTSYSIKVLGSNSLISSKKAKEELGYTTRPLKESIKDTILWFKEIDR